MSKKIFCFVPHCKSTSTRNPNKHFFRVPLRQEVRNRWIQACSRDPACTSSKTTFYCCQDHFNINEDLENLIQYRLTQGKVLLKLKPGVIPHKFACQEGNLPNSSRKKFLPWTSIPDFKPSKHDQINSQEIKETPPCKLKSTASQVYFGSPPIMVSRSTQTIDVVLTKEDAPQALLYTLGSTISTSAMKRFSYVDTVTAITPKKKKKDDVIACSFSSSSNVDPDDLTDHLPATSSPGSSNESKEINTEKSKMLALFYTVSMFFIKDNVQLYLGIPEQSASIITLLLSKIGISERDLFICLAKIRENRPFSKLAAQFGISSTQASRIFKKFTPLIAGQLKPLIFWPSSQDIKKQLPIPFRKSYSQVESIIDCFEIQVEKPTNSKIQSVTWSKDCQCNTIKYLISCTPNGFVNFISKGFGGRATDQHIVEASGYLNKITPGCAVMADRGFKHISVQLNKINSKLIRPPSVYKGQALSQEEAREAKQIFSLRVHMEQMIGRFREFNALAPHSTLDKDLMCNLDNMVTIAAAIINIQSPLIREQKKKSTIFV